MVLCFLCCDDWLTIFERKILTILRRNTLSYFICWNWKIERNFQWSTYKSIVGWFHLNHHQKKYGLFGIGACWHSYTFNTRVHFKEKLKKTKKSYYALSVTHRWWFSFFRLVSIIHCGQWHESGSIFIIIILVLSTRSICVRLFVCFLLYSTVVARSKSIINLIVVPWLLLPLMLTLLVQLVSFCFCVRYFRAINFQWKEKKSKPNQMTDYPYCNWTPNVHCLPIKPIATNCNLSNGQKRVFKNNTCTYVHSLAIPFSLSLCT